jgi:hypothetical protein
MVPSELADLKDLPVEDDKSGEEDLIRSFVDSSKKYAKQSDSTSA